MGVRARSGPGGPRYGSALARPHWTCPVVRAKRLTLLVRAWTPGWRPRMAGHMGVFRRAPWWRWWLHSSVMWARMGAAAGGSGLTSPAVMPGSGARWLVSSHALGPSSCHWGVIEGKASCFGTDGGDTRGCRYSS